MIVLKKKFIVFLTGGQIYENHLDIVRTFDTVEECERFIGDATAYGVMEVNMWTPYL